LAFSAKLDVNTVPANIGFDVIARYGDREYKVGSIALANGKTGTFLVGAVLPDLDPNSPPTSFDLILRSDEQVGRESVDEHDIWKGELIFPDLRTNSD
jgi:hypothetical protein